jgi:hypothetical protein
MKTREEVEELKRQWIQDGIFDLYEVEGFEEYREELIEFQNNFVENKKILRESERKANLEMYKKEAEELGVPLWAYHIMGELSLIKDELISMNSKNF